MGPSARVCEFYRAFTTKRNGYQNNNIFLISGLNLTSPELNTFYICSVCVVGDCSCACGLCMRLCVCVWVFFDKTQNVERGMLNVECLPEESRSQTRFPKIHNS